MAKNPVTNEQANVETRSDETAVASNGTVARTKYNRPSSDNVKSVDELGEWVTSDKAADMLGIRTSSVSYLVYGGKLEGIRISGVILIKKTSVADYLKEKQERERELAEKRAQRTEEDKAKDMQRKVAAQLKNLSPEKLAAALKQLGLEVPTAE